jgi:hypothetical protein
MSFRKTPPSSSRLSLPVSLAAVLLLAIPHVARAQSVLVRSAPAGSTAEVVLNNTPVGTATVDADGNASIPLDLAAHGVKPDVDVHLHVEVCGTTTRVLVLERAVQPPPADAGCDRRDVTGLFFLRRVTTLVVNIASATPTIMLIQGPFRPGDEVVTRSWRAAPTGLVLSGGAGLGNFSNAVALACGDVQGCTGDGAGIAYTGGVGYWVLPFLGAEATFTIPADMTASGSGNAYRFDSRFDSRLVTIVGKAGVPAGPVRVYGQFGALFHRSLFRTDQTDDDQTVTFDGVAQTIPGNTQTFELPTEGWGMLFGGGLEVWISSRIGVYGEFGRGVMKGSARDDREGSIDERFTSVFGGIRLHIGP